MNTIRRVTRTGRGFRERMTIRGFKTIDDMHKFLNAQNNNDWKITGVPDYSGHFDPKLAALKPGIYAYAGGEWHNVKTIDPSVLAHI
jgi:hypothetical protein